MLVAITHQPPCHLITGFHWQLTTELTPATCYSIYLSLIVYYFCFPLVSIFHPFAVKFALIGKEFLVSTKWSHLGTRRMKNLVWVQFCWMFHLQKHTCCVTVVVFGTLITCGKDALLSFNYIYIKMQQDHSWPSAWATWTVATEKSPHAHWALVKSYGACESLAAVHQPIGTVYF
jgi:hypothetical protein